MEKELQKKFTLIMVIDDCPIEIHLRKKLLTHGNHAFKVIGYQSALIALEYLKDIKNFAVLPQIILLDQHMPEMTGVEFMEEYNKLPVSVISQSQIYFISSTIDREEIRMIQGIDNVAGFQQKPLTTAFLKSL